MQMYCISQDIQHIIKGTRKAPECEMLLLASLLLLPRCFGRGVARGDAGGWRVSSDAHSRHGNEGGFLEGLAAPLTREPDEGRRTAACQC